MVLGRGRENRKITFPTYGFTFGRHGDPGVVEWPWGAVLGARWQFLIPAQRHFLKDRRSNGQSEAPNSHRNQFFGNFGVKNIFWGVFGTFPWRIRKIQKNNFFTIFHLWIFREFLATARKPEGQLFRGNKKIFFWCKIEKYLGTRWGPTIVNYAAHAPTLS